MKTISLTQGYTAFVDDSFDVAGTWQAKPDPRCNTVYARRNITKTNGKRTSQYLHRLVLLNAGIAVPKGMIVDHRDRNGLNNQLANLRLVNRVGNRANTERTKRNTSGFKGVAWYKRDQTWYARIGISGKTKFLGAFDSPEDAARAYDLAAIKYFGECAFLNFPAANDNNRNQ